MNRRYAETAALAGTMTAVASAFCLYKTGIFWAGSVNQLHAACAATGALASGISACDRASTAYSLLYPLMLLSAVAAVGGLVAVWLSEVSAIREARK